MSTDTKRSDHQALVAARLAAQRREEKLIRAAVRLGALLDPQRPTGWDDLYRNGASTLERV